eukprot:1160147-Pelagomonas_calceolata.AAC.6
MGERKPYNETRAYKRREYSQERTAQLGAALTKINDTAQRERKKQAVNKVSTSDQEKRIPRGDRLHQEKKKEKRSMGSRKVTSSTPCLISVMIVQEAFL